MRLLNSKTQKLEFFQGNEIPDYAILSHTWGDGEVSFQDMADINKAKTMKGFSKIEATCKQAIADGWAYIWVDTCCINKESSSELSEAINSMYAWYEKSEVCYAYLADVPSNEDPKAPASSFATCKWFNRGWTLQELLAPSSVIFYGKDWVEIGTKASLQDVISTITGIESAVILSNHGGEVSVGKRMSWAANRQTTREEDIAYCLMGLFGVNMPMIYGEGRNAFIRLQQEIMKLSDDQTLFAWKAVAGGDRGLLAHSPAEFFDSRNIVKADDVEGHHSHYAITNKGLQINVPLIAVKDSPDLFLAPLNCTMAGDNKPMAVYLQKDKGNRYIRKHTHALQQLSPQHRQVNPSSIFVKERDFSIFDISQRMRPQSVYEFAVKAVMPVEHKFQISEAHPPELWDNGQGSERLLTMKGSGTSGILVFQSVTTRERFAVILGVHNYSTWSNIAVDLGKDTAHDIRESYYSGKRSGLWRNLDRSSAKIQTGLTVSVSMKKVHTSQKKLYRTDITVTRAGTVATSGSHFSRPAGTQYAFRVTIPESNGHGFTLAEAFPTDTKSNVHWIDDHNEKILLIGGSGTSGILMFKNKSTKEKFAVMMGIHNYEVWTDIVKDFGDESAEDIRGSYYRDNGRGSQLWEQRKLTNARLSDGKIAVAISVRSNNKADFMTDITIGTR